MSDIKLPGFINGMDMVEILPQGFQGLLVAEHVLAGLHDQGKPRVDGFIGLLDLLLGSHDVQV